MIRSIPFLIREAYVNLMRHGIMTAAAISSLAVALSLCGSFFIAAWQVRHLAQKTVDAFEVRVFCRADLPQSELGPIKRKLLDIRGVKQVIFISREDSFKTQMKSMPIDTTGIPNLFPHTLLVKLGDPKAAADVAFQAKSWHGEVESVDVPEDELRTVVRIGDFLRNLGIIGGFLLGGGALLVVMNTIRLSVHARRREVHIMRIVGATAGFIRLPMVVEGMIHGLAGGLAASLILYGAGFYVRKLTEPIPIIVMYAAKIAPLPVGGAIIGAGVLLGMVGSLMSLQRYLKL